MRPVIWFINRCILSTVSTLLHVRRFIPVSVIRIHLMRRVIWFINRWSGSLIQVWQLCFFINRDSRHNLLLLLIGILCSPCIVRIVITEIILVPK
ncbi:hypothetical protein Hanom_Chr14g01278371 [Helianthus anomalus]